MKTTRKIVLLFVSILLSVNLWSQQSVVTEAGEIHIFGDDLTVRDTKKPVIRFTHAKNLTVTSKEFIIEGTASDESGIYRVFVEGGKSVKTSDFAFDEELTVGENNFQIVAVDNSHNETIENLTIYYKVERKDYAVLFYVSDYGGGTKDLEGTEKDALKLEDVLKEEYGFETEVCPNFTSEQMDKKIKEYAKKEYNEKDQLLIYYSGHGKIDDFDAGSLLCYNNSEYAHDQFSKFADGNGTSKCKHILMLVDACYSGLIVDKLDIRTVAEYKPTAEEYMNELLKEQAARKLLTSGEGVSNTGKDEGLSEFTKAFIKTLTQTHGKYHGIVTYKELAENLKENYPKLKGGKFNDNDNAMSNFIFIRKQD